MADRSYVELTTEAETEEFMQDIFSNSSPLSLSLRHMLLKWRVGILKQNPRIFIDRSLPDWSICLCAFYDPEFHGPEFKFYHLGVFCKLDNFDWTESESAKDSITGYTQFYAAVANVLDLYGRGFIVYAASKALQKEFIEALEPLGIKGPDVIPDHWLIQFPNDLETLNQLNLELKPLFDGHMFDSMSSDSDVHAVVQNWPHKDVAGAEAYFAFAAKYFPSSCIRSSSDGNPIAWSLSYEWGALASTFVVEQFRGLGYGKIVSLYTAIKSTKQFNLPCFATVDINNVVGRKTVEFMKDKTVPVTFVFFASWKLRKNTD